MSNSPDRNTEPAHQKPDDTRIAAYRETRAAVRSPAFAYLENDNDVQGRA
jgi:hypothetical protein